MTIREKLFTTFILFCVRFKPLMSLPYRLQCLHFDSQRKRIIKKDAKRYKNGDFQIIENPDGYGIFIDFCRGKSVIDDKECTTVHFTINGKGAYGGMFDNNAYVRPKYGQRIKYKKSSSVDYNGEPLYWLDYLSVKD